MRRTFARKKKNKRHELLYTAQLKRDAMKKDNEWGFYTLPTQTDPEKYYYILQILHIESIENWKGGNA